MQTPDQMKMSTSRGEIAILLLVLLLNCSLTNSLMNPLWWPIKFRLRRDKFLRGFIAGYLFSSQTGMTQSTSGGCSPAAPFAGTMPVG